MQTLDTHTVCAGAHVGVRVCSVAGARAVRRDGGADRGGVRRVRAAVRLRLLRGLRYQLRFPGTSLPISERGCGFEGTGLPTSVWGFGLTGTSLAMPVVSRVPVYPYRVF